MRKYNIWKIKKVVINVLTLYKKYALNIIDLGSHAMSPNSRRVKAMPT